MRECNLISRLVLGAATFGKLTQSEDNILIRTAQECGITRIDTVHGYEKSEEMIGQCLKSNVNLQINTKVDLPNRVAITQSGIRLSLEESLRRLKIKKNTTLFVNSLETGYLTDKNITAMGTLKEQCKVIIIGYAGGGDNLGIAA